MAFTSFPKLPGELQIKIWKSVDPDPNIVTIKKGNTITVKQDGGRTKQFINYQAKASYTVPALLHTCYTSRKIALESYQPHFEKHLGHPLYFDFNKDILNIEECEALASFLQVPWFADLQIDVAEVNQVKFLAITGVWISYQDRMLQRLQRFEGLETLYFQRATGEKASLMSHFEWGLRMKWQTWKTWMKVGPGSSVEVPEIRFLEEDQFRKLVNTPET